MQEINNIMMNQGGMVAGAANGSDMSPYSYFRPSGGFSWERPETMAPITPAPVAVETPATCEAKGMIYNSQTKLCEMPPPPPVRTRDDDGGGPPPPEATPWYKSTDWSTEGAESSVEKYFGKGAKVGSAIGSVIGGVVGGLPGATVGAYGMQVSNLATARAEIEIRKAMGDTAGAELLQKAIDDQIKASVGLGKADEVINAIFGSDGDMKVIDALVAAGIKVDKGLRDNALKDFLGQLSIIDKNLLGKFYGGQTPGVGLKAGDTTKLGGKVRTDKTMTQAQRNKIAADIKEKAKGKSAGRDLTGGGLEEAKKIIKSQSDDGPSAAEIAAARARTPTAKASTGTKTTEEAKAATASAVQKYGRATGGRATGGLVSRPKKKK